MDDRKKLKASRKNSQIFRFRLSVSEATTCQACYVGNSCDKCIKSPDPVENKDMNGNNMGTSRFSFDPILPEVSSMDSDQEFQKLSFLNQKQHLETESEQEEKSMSNVNVSVIPDLKAKPKLVLSNPFAPLKTSIEISESHALDPIFYSPHLDVFSGPVLSPIRKNDQQEIQCISNICNVSINSATTTFWTESDMDGLIPDHLNPFRSKEVQHTSLRYHIEDAYNASNLAGVYFPSDAYCEWAQFRRFPILQTLSNSDKTCSLCTFGFVHEIPRGKVIFLECMHILHEVCFEYWMHFNRCCPSCYKEIRRNWLMSSEHPRNSGIYGIAFYREELCCQEQRDVDSTKNLN